MEQMNSCEDRDEKMMDVLSLLLIMRRRRKRKNAKKKHRQKPRFWVRPIFQWREQHGEYHCLVQELLRGDREYFFRYFRMSPNRFQHLLGLVSPLISKKDTSMRKAITPEERLALRLRFLATGDSQQSLSFSFRIGKVTVSRIIAETCDAIYEVLKGAYLSVPKTKDDWLKISQDFEEKWNMPHTVGCIDGKHIRIECPKLTGTQYYNYKGFFSIVLMAICDANYCFTVIDIGQYGSNNDSGILASSVMGEMFEMNLPSPSKIHPLSNQELPYFLLGDGIFPLKHWLMRPFPGTGASEEERIYNYRQSKARRCIENTFRILSQRWRIFFKPIKATAKHVESYTLACMALHNYLRLTTNAKYVPAGFVDSEDSNGNLIPGDWRKDSNNNDGAFGNLAPYRGSRSKPTALDIRDALKDYVIVKKAVYPGKLIMLEEHHITLFENLF